MMLETTEEDLKATRQKWKEHSIRFDRKTRQPNPRDVEASKEKCMKRRAVEDHQARSKPDDLDLGWSS